VTGLHNRGGVFFFARYELNLEINNLVDRGEPKFFIRFSPVRLFQEMLCTDLNLKTPLTGKTNERSLVTLKKQCSLRNLGALDRPVLPFRL